jgi:hypothetical protein
MSGGEINSNLVLVVFNVLFGVIGAAGMWWVNVIWSRQNDQQKEIGALNIKLAEGYATRTELQPTFDRIFDKLDEIQRTVKRE